MMGRQQGGSSRQQGERACGRALARVTQWCSARTTEVLSGVALVKDTRYLRANVRVTCGRQRLGGGCKCHSDVRVGTGKQQRKRQRKHRVRELDHFTPTSDERSHTSHSYHRCIKAKWLYSMLRRDASQRVLSV